MKLHNRIKELRNQKDLTLKELAEITGLSVSYLSDLERGRTNPSLNSLDTLAAAFDMTVVELLNPVEFSDSVESELELPQGLDELVNSEYGDEITPEWISMLRKIELRGKRPQTKDDWLMLYLHLKRILE